MLAVVFVRVDPALLQWKTNLEISVDWHKKSIFHSCRRRDFFCIRKFRDLGSFLLRALPHQPMAFKFTVAEKRKVKEAPGLKPFLQPELVLSPHLTVQEAVVNANWAKGLTLTVVVQRLNNSVYGMLSSVPGTQWVPVVCARDDD